MNVTALSAQYKNPAHLEPADSSRPASDSSAGRCVWATALAVRLSNQAPDIQGSNVAGLFGDLNSCYAVMQQIIEQYSGYIHRFDGDALLASFGLVQESSEHAERGVAASIRLRQALTEINDRRRERGDRPFRIGIGVNTGQMIVGDLQLRGEAGSAVLGEGIDAARHLGNLNTQTPFHTIFVSQSTLTELPSLLNYHVDNLGDVHLAGTARPVTVYALMDPLSA